ncbi:hypothetical protein DM860_015368 [Cuscuta australis]|uniref:Uncharacterized protein n=1 Tax=Cuscuta australis TaxID=267555 RepID=A0A328DKX6_9ASTE|nr:hypothetical protein DM860_015368 [Cuscuta australis]
MASIREEIGDRTEMPEIRAFDPRLSISLRNGWMKFGTITRRLCRRVAVISPSYSTGFAQTAPITQTGPPLGTVLQKILIPSKKNVLRFRLSTYKFVMMYEIEESEVDKSNGCGKATQRKHRWRSTWLPPINCRRHQTLALADRVPRSPPPLNPRVDGDWLRVLLDALCQLLI